jgi:fucose 4-O-acetylase-like acetyltransferase
MQTANDSTSQRDYYIDRLRVIIIVLVVLHHTAITYGAPGGWFYNELHPSATLPSLLLTIFVSVNQAFFMGFFFLLSGYYTPGSFARKGWARFLTDRFVRLGIPLLFFALVLAPITVAIAHGTPLRKLPHLWLAVIPPHDFILGPPWFCWALLIFSLAYCLWRAFREPVSKAPEMPLPSGRSWLLSALGVGLGALLIRQVAPVGRNYLGLQLGYFSSYIFLFVLGTVAWRGNWLKRLPRATARVWGIIAICAIVMMPAIIALDIVLKVKNANWSGGLNSQAIFYAFWEPFVAWGIIAWLIVVFRDRWNLPSRLWERLGEQAYTVFIIHPPVLVAFAVLMHNWHAAALIKFAVVGMLAWITCGLLAWGILQIPGIRRVL